MRGARCELAEGYELFRLDQLRLEALEIFDRLLRPRKQSHAIFVGDVGAIENDQHQWDRCDQRRHGAIVANFVRLVGVVDRINSK